MALRKWQIGCPCCCLCKNTQICIVVDTTGSMASFLAAMKNVFVDLRDEFDSDTCDFALVQYKDVEDGTSHWDGTSTPVEDYGTGWHVVIPFTNDYDELLVGVNSLTHAGGGDLPEQQLMTLEKVGNEWFTTLGGEADGTGDPIRRIVIWAGDAAGWADGAKGHSYPTRQEAIDALLAVPAKVFAVNSKAAGAGIDYFAANDSTSEPYQATDIVTQTDGQLFNYSGSDSTDLIEALCAAFRAPI